MNSSIQKLWILFAQSVTILLAAWFVVATFKPQWITNTQVISMIENVSLKEAADDDHLSPGSYHDAVKRSMPAVVNIFTSKSVCSKQRILENTDNRLVIGRADYLPRHRC